MQLKRAKRQKLIASVAIIGPSGAGKTLGGLLVGYGMMKEKYPDLSDSELWEKIGLIDTEHERSLVYEGMTHQGVKVGEFMFISLEKPYTVDRYDKAVKMMKEAGVEVVIIDSISHAWESDGGLLDLQQQMGGNFQAWAKVNPVYRQFTELTTGEKHRIHTISTVRAKQSYQVETSEIGKLEIKKMGLQPVQRDSLEYEFQVVFNVDMDHIARTSKDNSGIFEAHPQKLNPKIGNKLFKWLEEGIDVKGEEEAERLTFIEMTKGIVAEYGLDAKLAELEKKGKAKLEDMDLRLAKRAYDLMTFAAKETEKVN